jgi:general secretion pathway protein G
MTHSPTSCRRTASRLGGFTMVELILAVAILATLATIALPQLQGISEKGAISQAVGELKGLESEIFAYLAANRALPPDLATIGRGSLVDPWGAPYEYFPFPVNLTVVPGGKSPSPAGARKDMFLVPVNADFDLYSKGPDGDSEPPFTSPVSIDDIVRAGNGGFFGVAVDF